MNDKLFRTILKRYEAAIEDANFKIECICDHNMVIPEHVDITGEIDKLLQIISEAEDKLSVMRKYYGKKEADRNIQIGRAHVRTPVTRGSRMPSSA